MKFIAFWEYEPEKSAKVFEKLEQLKEHRKKVPEKYPKVISGPYHFSGEFKGITLFEAEDDVQIVNLYSYYQPEMVMNFVPILDLDDASDLITDK